MNFPSRWAGVHLSGANASKTSLVVLEGRPGRSPLEAPLKIGKVYEKIGSFGTLFSDERLVEILTRAGPFREVFVDCPLTVPPCVACQRPVCPGAVKCDDVSVAYMLSMSNKVRRKGARKARPVNPQSQRLWDVMNLEDGSQQGAPRMEPSYSANLAPLVARARTLQRRLNALTPPPGGSFVLKETSVANTLEAVRHALRLPATVRLSYRSFEEGLDRRRAILDRMVEAGWIEDEDDLGEGAAHEDVAQSVETFHAFFAAWVGSLHSAGLTTEEPEGYVPGEGWVYVPEISNRVELQTRYFE